MFDLLTQKQLRLTPTLSNCDALLSMLRLLVFACQQTIGAKPLECSLTLRLCGFSGGWMANSS
ncbi:hypothetical protein JT121_04330 [Helicobacter pylori]|nr:hypothetical protein [Helicobacter pylori]